MKCHWWLGGHRWEWGDVQVNPEGYGLIQIGYCERCGIGKAREIWI